MERKSAWDKIKDKEIVFKFCDEYIKYLDMGKTERKCVEYTKLLAERNGFKDIDTVEKLSAGMKIYKINRGKNIAIGGNITDTTQASMRYAPYTSAPLNHHGAPI